MVEAQKILIPYHADDSPTVAFKGRMGIIKLKVGHTAICGFGDPVVFLRRIDAALGGLILKIRLLLFTENLFEDGAAGNNIGEGIALFLRDGQ